MESRDSFVGFSYAGRARRYVNEGTIQYFCMKLVVIHRVFPKCTVHLIMGGELIDICPWVDITKQGVPG